MSGESECYRTVGDRLRHVTPAIVLIGVAATCWVVTAQRMQGMDMGPGTPLGGVGWFAVVWVTMMAAMMLPSLLPMALTHARVSTGAGAASPTAASAVFAGGYLLVWAGAGLVAYALFDGVRSLGLPWLAWNQGGRYLAGGVILGAALYEATPAKSRCLRHCRNPELLTRRWRPGVPGALPTGLEHGAFCVGSSWALMTVLFAVGVMNVTWMVVLAALVAIQKLLPSDRVAVGASVAFIAILGVAVAVAPHQVPALTVPG